MAFDEKSTCTFMKAMPPTTFFGIADWQVMTVDCTCLNASRIFWVTSWLVSTMTDFMVPPAAAQVSRLLCGWTFLSVRSQGPNTPMTNVWMGGMPMAPMAPDNSEATPDTSAGV